MKNSGDIYVHVYMHHSWVAVILKPENTRSLQNDLLKVKVTILYMVVLYNDISLLSIRVHDIYYDSCFFIIL